MTNIAELFPIEFNVTEEIIKNATPLDNRLCQGALSLTAALGEFGNGRTIVWGRYHGWIDGLCITTKEEVDMMSITEPTKVIFIVKEDDNNIFDEGDEMS